MNRRTLTLVGLAILIAASPVLGDNAPSNLARAVPDDAFLMVIGRPNPERAFIDEYWCEVFDALCKSGVDKEVMGLFGFMMGEQQQAEIQRLRDLGTDLFHRVQWKQLVGREMVFAERLSLNVSEFQRAVALPPEFVVMLQGESDTVDENYDGLMSILRTFVDEVNRAADAEALSIRTETHAGVPVASINLLESAPGAPQLHISLARRDDVILVSFGKSFIYEVLDRLAAPGKYKSLVDDPRFVAAFAKLPPAEDSQVFFDMQRMLQPFGTLMQHVATGFRSPGDEYVNTGGNLESNQYNAAALKAYQSGDYAKALELVEKAHAAAPDDAIALYNLACFSALNNKPDDAIDWLEKAVDAGFYAPSKISTDSDLDSIRRTPRYTAAVERAGELAARHSARDIVMNSSKEGEAYKLCQQAWQLSEDKEYEEGLRLLEQALAAAPDDSRVFYYLACFHSRLGHDDTALNFLERAVKGGFYCPNHIAKDPDLAAIRDNERYDAALALAREQAAANSQQRSGDEAKVFLGVANQIMDAVGVLDCVATVEYTDGFTTHSDSVAMLVPDAKTRPIYSVIGSAKPLTDFDRFLPKETESFSVSSGLDLGALYDFLLSIVRSTGSDGEELLASWDELQTQIGVNVREDLISWIGGVFAEVTLAGGDSVVIVKVNDGERASEVISAAVERVSALLTKLGAENPPLAMLSIQTGESTDEELAGFHEITLAIAPMNPVVWGVAEGHLMFSTSADALKTCLRTARGEHPNIRANERAMSEMLLPAEGDCVSIALTDQRHLGEDIAQVCIVVGPMSGMMGMAIPDPKARQVITKIGGIVTRLAPVARKIDFFKSNACCTTFDGSVWYTRCVTHYVDPASRKKSEPQTTAAQ